MPVWDSMRARRRMCGCRCLLPRRAIPFLIAAIQGGCGGGISGGGCTSRGSGCGGAGCGVQCAGCGVCGGECSTFRWCNYFLSYFKLSATHAATLDSPGSGGQGARTIVCTRRCVIDTMRTSTLSNIKHHCLPSLRHRSPTILGYGMFLSL